MRPARAVRFTHNPAARQRQARWRIPVDKPMPCPEMTVIVTDAVKL